MAPDSTDKESLAEGLEQPTGIVKIFGRRAPEVREDRSRAESPVPPSEAVTGGGSTEEARGPLEAISQGGGGELPESDSGAAASIGDEPGGRREARFGVDLAEDLAQLADEVLGRAEVPIPGEWEAEPVREDAPAPSVSREDATAPSFSRGDAAAPATRGTQEDDAEPALPNPLDFEPTRELRWLLRDKAAEFGVLGYGHVSPDDLWRYFQSEKKRRPKNLHELVNALLSLQPQAFMNFTMRQSYKESKTLDEWARESGASGAGRRESSGAGPEAVRGESSGAEPEAVLGEGSGMEPAKDGEAFDAEPGLQ